jgi:hypothetical protein
MFDPKDLLDAIVAGATVKHLWKAASEGSVLGIGGQKVSPAEKSALTNIAKALGVAA